MLVPDTVAQPFVRPTVALVGVVTIVAHPPRIAPAPFTVLVVIVVPVGGPEIPSAPPEFRAMVPILLTQSIILFQDTSLVYVVGLHDFLTAATIVAGRDNRVVELYSFVAVVYLVLCVSASLGVRRLQARFGR